MALTKSMISLFRRPAAWAVGAILIAFLLLEFDPAWVMARNPSPVFAFEIREEQLTLQALKQ